MKIKLIRNIVGYKTKDLYIARQGICKSVDISFSDELLSLTHNKLLSLVKKRNIIYDDDLIIVKETKKTDYNKKYQNTETFDYYADSDEFLVGEYSKVVQIICPYDFSNSNRRIKYKDIEKEKDDQINKMLLLKK